MWSTEQERLEVARIEFQKNLNRYAYKIPKGAKHVYIIGELPRTFHSPITHWSFDQKPIVDTALEILARHFSVKPSLWIALRSSR